MTEPPRPPDRRPPPGPPPVRPGPRATPGGARPPSVDWALAAKAGLNGLVFVAPAALAGQVLADEDGDLGGGTAFAVIAVQLLGFAFAGWVVRRLEPLSPIATCAAGGVTCWAILQAVGIVTSLVRGQNLSPLTWAATGLLAALTAAAGGLLARVERVPRTPSVPPEDTP